MPLLSTDTSSVTAVKSASAQEAEAHFSRLLSLQTDCWDVHAALESNAPGFVLLDVRVRKLTLTAMCLARAIFPMDASTNGIFPLT
jgi:hypothetical protein